ncbi:LacI family DNA-binding transcriptional regulator [Aquicoccus sp. SCR17]|nr:LacI family DNA-binding transcriptional regulator [Carideicomes alvinocaridis]
MVSRRSDTAQDDPQTEPRRRRSSTYAGVRDVARLAGVSTATVSRVFNRPESVSKDIRRKVLDAADTLTYIPHNGARALSSHRSQTLGVVIPTIQNSIFAEQVEHLQARGAELGYNLVVKLAGFDKDRELEQVRELLRNGVDGIMLIGADHRPELYRLLEARRIAFVNTSVCDPASPYPSVGFDNAGAMARMTRHLLSLGHRRIGVLAGDIEGSDRVRLRLDGIEQALAEEGLELPDHRLIFSSYSMADSRASCRELIRRDPNLTAIICHNDVQAFAAVLELQSLGISVPDQCSVTGFDDLEWARHLVPALTTVRVDWGRMARLATDALVAQLDEKDFAHTTQVDADLVLRDSTAPPPDA